MRHASHLQYLTILLVTVALVGCQADITSPMEGPEYNSVTAQATQSQSNSCVPTGTGLTAKVVNQDVIRQTIEIGDCDVGAYFDEDGVVKKSTFNQPNNNPAPSEQFLVRVEGDAEVDVTNSKFHVTEGYGDQIVHVGLIDGATGDVTRNVLTGRKRAGILLDGSGTSAVVKGNKLTGVGPTTSGWAENGIQVSRGATGTVKNNKVADHWWDDKSFASSGVIVFGSDDVTVHGNTLRGNDLAVALVGDGNKAKRNQAGVSHSKAQTTGFAGAFVSGDPNSVQNNVFGSNPTDPADYGIFDAGTNTTIKRNVINGFSTAIESGNNVDENVLTPAADRSPNS